MGDTLPDQGLMLLYVLLQLIPMVTRRRRINLRGKEIEADAGTKYYNHYQDAKDLVSY
jgi:hypothetical protein